MDGGAGGRERVARRRASRPLRCRRCGSSAPARRAAAASAGAVRIVGVEDGDARRRIEGAVEEKPLGGEVLLHRLVVVEVVAGEVGEDGDVEGDAAGAALVEGVAGDFGDEFGGAALTPSAISSKRSRDSGVV